MISSPRPTAGHCRAACRESDHHGPAPPCRGRILGLERAYRKVRHTESLETQISKTGGTLFQLLCHARPGVGFMATRKVDFAVLGEASPLDDRLVDSRIVVGDFAAFSRPPLAEANVHIEAELGGLVKEWLAVGRLDYGVRFLWRGRFEGLVHIFLLLDDVPGEESCRSELGGYD